MIIVPYIILRDDWNVCHYLFTSSVELPEVTDEDIKNYIVNNYSKEDFRVRDDICDNEDNDGIIIQYFYLDAWNSIELNLLEFKD